MRLKVSDNLDFGRYLFIVFLLYIYKDWICDCYIYYIDVWNICEFGDILK